MTSANVVKQIPFNTDLSLSGLTSQESGVGLHGPNNIIAPTDAYVAHSQTPVVVTRNSLAVSQNPVNGDLTAVTVDEPAYGGVGIQIGRQKDNELNNSDARGGTASYVLTDTGGIVTLFTAEDSGIDESAKALRLTMVNPSGVTESVFLHQSIATGLINEYWTAQTSVKVLSTTGPVLTPPITLARIFDFSNTQIATNTVPPSTDVFTRSGATIQLTAGSADLRWSIECVLPATTSLDILVTNNSLVNSSWQTHYIPSTVGPTTRESDVVDVGAALDPFFAHLVDEMWSVDFSTLGVLTAIAGGESQLQYLFSSYNGINGTNLFVDDVDTITWQGDFNSVQVTAAPGRTLTFADTNPDTITASTGDFVADGFTVGATLTVAGTASNNGTFTIDVVTATVITLIAPDTLVAEGPLSATATLDVPSGIEDVSMTVAGLGVIPHRAYMRTLDDGAGGYDRELFVENLVTGVITASTLLNTLNLPIQGDFMKIGRDDSDANILDGYLGRLVFWGNRNNLSMNRINDNWPTP